MVGCFDEVIRRRGLNVNEGKRKVMVMNGEGGDWLASCMKMSLFCVVSRRKI